MQEYQQFINDLKALIKYADAGVPVEDIQDLISAYEQKVQQLEEALIQELLPQLTFKSEDVAVVESMLQEQAVTSPVFEKGYPSFEAVNRDNYSEPFEYWNGDSSIQPNFIQQG